MSGGYKMQPKHRLSLVIVILVVTILIAQQGTSLGKDQVQTGIQLLQDESSYSQNPDRSEAQKLDSIIQQIIEYAQTEQEDDPYIEIEPNLWIKQSNYKGIKLNGQTYYYSLFPHMSYDPVSRGEIDAEDITIIYHDEQSEFPIIIYVKKT